MIGIGAIIDEAVLNQYLYKTNCAKARKIIVWLWIILGFLITICYKSVLLANMTYPQYEKAIDSVEDMLNSDKPLMVIRSMRFLFDTDPRPQVNKLSKKVIYYDFEMKKMPQEILDGYIK